VAHEYKIPEVGQKAPDFTLPASNGKTIELLKLAAKQPVVLYFYPKADTPGCTKEAAAFAMRGPITRKPASQCWASVLIRSKT